MSHPDQWVEERGRAIEEFARAARRMRGAPATVRLLQAGRRGRLDEGHEERPCALVVARRHRVGSSSRFEVVVEDEGHAPGRDANHARRMGPCVTKGRVRPPAPQDCSTGRPGAEKRCLQQAFSVAQAIPSNIAWKSKRGGALPRRPREPPAQRRPASRELVIGNLQALRGRPMTCPRKLRRGKRSVSKRALGARDGGGRVCWARQSRKRVTES